MRTEIDEVFIAQVYKTSACVWAIGLVICLATWQLEAAAGWTVGAALSMATLRSLEWIVRRCFVPGQTKAKASLARFSLIKLIAVAAVLSGVVLLGGRSFVVVGVFCAGVILTQAVIFAKAVKIVVHEHFVRE